VIGSGLIAGKCLNDLASSIQNTEEPLIKASNAYGGSAVSTVFAIIDLINKNKGTSINSTLLRMKSHY
jgi:hypothetical protein